MQQPLIAAGLVRRFDNRTVLDGFDLIASPGHRIGLIGENGSGKSTLLQLLAGVDEPDSGAVTRPDDLVHVPQEPDLPPGTTVGDVLDEALAPSLAAIARLGELALDVEAQADAYSETLAWAVDHDAWDAPRRAEVAAALLGVGHLPRTRVTDQLSGGQRTRLCLVSVIVRMPWCVLLDEPTNHLDAAAVDLLETTLTMLPGIVVAASHDRAFLDRVCTDLVDLDPSPDGPRRFGGSWSSYEQHRAAERRRWEERFRLEQAEIAELRERTAVELSDVAPGRAPRDNDKFIYGFKGARVQQAVTRRKRDAERRLDQALRSAVRKPPRLLELAVDGQPSGTPVTVTGLRVTDRLALDHLAAATGEHLLVTGANGSGKSTLLQVLAGRLQPSSGTVQVSGRVGLLEQDTTFADESLTARQVFGEQDRPLSSLGLIHPRDVDRPVGELSTGQRRRLALAQLLVDPPDLLLLDEPTNHLSPTLVGELTEALQSLTATIIVASHDRWLRERWAGPSVALSPA